MAELAINGGPKVFDEPVRVRWPEVDQRDEEALLKVLRSGSWWRGGTVESQDASECGTFERAFAAMQGAEHALAVFNGTVAVECALRACGVGPGDEVIVPALSFVVSASAALPLAAVPVFADADPETLQSDPDAIEAAITPRTKAIVIVHFGGYPADLDRITAVAEKHNLPLIEDCAHAQGSQWRGKGVGTYGDYGTFSFQQSKSITSGEGGMILAKTLDHRQRAYRYHNLGRLETQGFYDFELLSSNLRITDLQGALLNSQLEKFPRQMEQRMDAAAFLSAELRKIGGVEPLPADERITRRGFYYYIFKYDAAQFGGVPRETFREALAAEGVTVGKAYGRSINEYPLFRNMEVPGEYTLSQYATVKMPVSEDACANRICTLAHQFLLADRATLGKMVEAVAKVKANAGELK
ncbi:MAG: DegT/DnrJ/EryC1/StrS family aminotransferase [Planctomycetota bacterium]